MNKTWRSYVVAGLLAVSSTAAAQSPLTLERAALTLERAAPSSPLVKTAPAPLLTTILARPRIDQAVIDRLYNDSIIKDGNIDRLVTLLSEQVRDSTRSKRYRVQAAFVSSHAQWRHGKSAAAITAAEEGLAIEAYDDLVYLKARLLDASGNAEQAAEWYRKALALAASAEMKETIRLRLTFVEAIDQNVESLVDLAKTRDHASRNRAAIALAILGFNNQAVEIYTPAVPPAAKALPAGSVEAEHEGSERFRQHLRVAQWAVKAGNAVKAKEEAWTAVQAATLGRDRQYGLSILIEAHMLDNSLDHLLTRLARKTTLSPEEQGVRIDLLRQTGQYQAAIDLFKSAYRGSELSNEMRHELLRMYRDAGQNEAMVAEYRQLIAGEPTATTWPEGLSQYYLEQGDQTSARRVWDEFLARNTDVDALLLGSESMTSFGLHDMATAATEKALAQDRGVAAQGRIRLEQYELYRARGLHAEADAALGTLETILPPDSGYRVELADAYERIQKPQMALKMWEGLAASRGDLSVDEKLRMAWLLDSTGRREDALKMWKTLWSTETQSTRRALVQDRLLTLAAELGQLGDIAVELEEKLAHRTATAQDSSLLVSIYTKVGDTVSAVEVLTETAANRGNSVEATIESLKEQQQVYLGLNEHQDFARVTRRLLEIDPANKLDYLQALLLNEIETGASATREKTDGSARLRDWMAQLRAVGGAEAVGGEFEAGVMELAGFRDQAIDAYRRALAQHPERGDNNLLLADLLKQGGRQEEAVAGLQYVAESADNDELFLIAMDGIMNMRTGNVTTVKWAERRALERLTSRDDKLYLYEMLSELAEEAKDVRIYFSALENSLAHADSRRSHVLRELLGATGESTMYATSRGLHRPDPTRNLTYARRLISLGEELPPEVYTDLGKTFLAMRDAVSAQRAFNLAIDRTGRASLVLDAARLLEQAGYEREAISQYEKALIVNSSDIRAMYSLARLRETTGTDKANDLYRQALLLIVHRQTSVVDKGSEATPPALESVLSFDYRRYYRSLLKGYLATLSAADGERASQVEPLEDAFQQELQRVVAPVGQAVGQAGPNALAYYPRLKVLAECVRSVWLATGAAASADRVDAALRQHFSRDPRLAAEIAENRAQWGFAPPAPPAPSGTGAVASAGAAQGASEPGESSQKSDFSTVVGTALVRGDQDGALAAYREWIKDAGLPKPPMRIGGMVLPDRSSGVLDVAAHASVRLDAKHFAGLAHYVSDLVNNQGTGPSEQDRYAEKILVTSPYGTMGTASHIPGDVQILTRLEEVLGQSMLTEERLAALINKRDNWQDLNLPYVMTRLSRPRQVEMLGRYATAETVNWDRFFTSFGVVLSKPLEPMYEAQLLPMLKTAFQVGFKKTSGMHVLPSLGSFRFTAYVHESNVHVIDDIEKFLAETFPQSFKAGYLKASVLRDLGRDRDALAAFVDAALQMYPSDPDGNQRGVPSIYTYRNYIRTFTSFIFPTRAAEVMRLLDEKERSPMGLTDALIALRIELYSSNPASQYGQLLSELQAMVDRHPDNELLLKTVYPLYEQWGHTGQVIDVLTRLTKLRPDNRLYQYQLLMAWQKLEYPEKAVEVAGRNTVDELSRAAAKTLPSSYVAGGPRVKRATDDIKALGKRGATPTSDDMRKASSGFRTLLQLLPPAGLTPTEYSLQARDSGDPYWTVRDLLAINWDASRPGDAEGDPTSEDPAPQASANVHDRLVRALEGADVAAATPRTPKLVEVVSRYPFAVDALEAHFRTMQAADIDRQYPFYDVLVDAYVKNGRAEAQLQRLTPLVRSGRASRKDVTVWLGLVSQQPAASAVQLVQGAESGAALAPRSMTDYQRLLLARVYAKAGQRARALEIYDAVATTVLAGAINSTYSYGVNSDPYGKDMGLTLFTGPGLFDEVRAHLDREAVDQFLTRLLALCKPPADPGLEQVYARFVMTLYFRTVQAGAPSATLQQEADRLKVSDAWTRSDLVIRTYMHVRSGRTEEALGTLRQALQGNLDVTVAPSYSYPTMTVRNYQVALGFVNERLTFTTLLPATTGSAVEEFKVLFPARGDSGPGADAWVARAARELPAWIARQAVNRDAGAQVLSLLVLRLHQMGSGDPTRREALQVAVKGLADVLRTGSVSIKAATLAVSAADEVGQPIDLAIAQELVRTNRLHISRIPGIITRTAQAQGTDQALQLGEAASRFTSNDALLARLVSIAQQAGKDAEAQRWLARQKQAATARDAL